MLILQIKKKWFDMIKSGEKKEEYREIKPYYKTRFYNAVKEALDKETFAQQLTAVILYDNTVMLDVIFRNGYNKNSPQIKCKCIYKGRGQGKEEWGAEKRKRVLCIRNIGGRKMNKKSLYNNVYTITGDEDYGCIYIAAKNGKEAKKIALQTWISETIDNPYINLRVIRKWGINTKYKGELNIRQINELGLVWWCCEECENEKFEIIDKYTYRCMKCGKTGEIPYVR